MLTPQPSDNLTFDTNAFICAALKFGPIKNIFSTPLNRFIGEWKKRDLVFGYFKFIKDQSYRNITYAITSIARRKGFKKSYILMKYKLQGVGNLDKLFLDLSEFQENISDEGLEKVKQFFIENEKDIGTFMNLQRIKSNIPEIHDIKLLACCDNHECSRMILVSDDSHFVAYQDEIENSSFDISVLPMKEIQQNMMGWDWI